MSLERSFPTVNVLRRNPNSPGYSCETASDASHPLSMGDRNAPLPPAPVGRGTSGIPSGPLRPLPRLPPPLNFQSLVVLPTLSHTAFAQATIHPQDWHFVAACQATLPRRLATTPGPTRGLTRTLLLTPATTLPRSHRPHWTDQQGADHG